MKTSRYSDIRIRGILKQAEVGLLINYQDTHRKYVAAYIKKLGLRFSVIVGVLVNMPVARHAHKVRIIKTPIVMNPKTIFWTAHYYACLVNSGV